MAVTFGLITTALSVSRSKASNPSVPRVIAPSITGSSRWSGVGVSATSVFQVVAALAAMSAFLTGFNSIRAHGYRDRSFHRLDRLYESTLDIASEDATTHVSIEELHHAAGELMTKRPPDVVVANLLLLLVSLGVAWIGGRGANWRLTISPDSDFWPLAALILAQMIVVAVMFTESRLVSSQLVEKLQWLTIRDPWAVVRAADSELANVELLIDRSLAARQEAKMPTAKKLVRACMRRAKRARDVLSMVSRVYDYDFAAISRDVKEMRAAAAALQKQSIWLAAALDWFSRFLRLPGGRVIEPPPERPDTPKQG